MEAIKNKRILALIGIGCLLVGTFLPYITVSILGYSRSISLWGYWEGKIVFLLALANALYIFKDFIEKNVPQLFNNSVGKMVQKYNNPKYSLVPTILIAVFAVYLLVTIDVDSEYLKYGLGFWTLWVGVIALVGHAIFYKKPNVQPQPIQSVQSQQPVNYAQPQQVQPVQQASFAQPEQVQPVQPASFAQPEQVQPVQPASFAQPEQVQPVQPASFAQPEQVQPVQPASFAQPQQVQPVQQNIEQNVKFCTECGAKCDINAISCHMCGKQF